MPRARQKPSLPMPPDNDLGARVDVVVMRAPRGMKTPEGKPMPDREVLPLQAKRMPGWREVARKEAGARAAEVRTVEAVPDDANGRRRRRGVHALEVMHRKALLTKRQTAAGEALSVAWEATQRSPSVDLSEERVDRSPRPDERSVILIAAQTRFGKLAKQVPVDCRAVVFRVACEGRAIGTTGNQRKADMIRLARGLDTLANHLGIG